MDGPSADDTERQAFLTTAIEAAGEVEDVELVELVGEPEALVLSISVRGREGRSTAYLGNLFRELRGAEAETIRSRLAGFFRTTVHAPDRPAGWDEAAPKLLAVLRSAGIRSWAINEPVTPVSEPSQPALVEMLVLDLGPSITYVTLADLEGWGVDVATARARGLENLVRLTPPPPEASEEGAVVRVLSGTIDAASYLLVPGWLSGFRAAVRGRPVAYAAGQDSVVVASADDPRRVLALAERAWDEWTEAARPVSPCLYTATDDGRVVPLSVEADHPAASAVARSRLHLLASEYATQKEALERRHEQTGDDVFVASMLAVETDDGVVRSISVWSRDVPTLLPHTDVVALLGDAEGREPPIEVAWARLEAEAGALLEPCPELWPPRVRVDAWPDEATLARLRAPAEG